MSRSSSSAGANWPAWGLVVVALTSLLMLSRLIGCSKNHGVPVPPPADRGTPAELVQRLVEKYQQATRYRDDGVLRLSLSRHGKPVPAQSWPAAVQFQRPGRIKIDAYNLRLASDAATEEPLLVAQVEDAESNNIDNQVVVRPAPPEVTFSALSADPILFSQLVGRIGRPPVQLELLLDRKPMAALLSKDAKLAWLDDAGIAGRNCRRIEYTAAEGKFVFWIDDEDLLLRRLEYPATSLLPDLAGDKAVSEARLVANLEGATFEPQEQDLSFSLPIPAQAKRMRAFVMPVIALDTRLLGHPARGFELTALDGQKINPATMEGKMTAFFWYAHHPACEKPLQEFAQLAKDFGDDQQAFAVCTEMSDVGDKAVRDQLAEWQVELVAARDLKQYHERIFQVRELPAITLFDAEGKFQWMGSGPGAAGELPEAMARLAKGENLALEALERERLARQQYEQLVAAGGPRLDTGLAAASSPKRFKLKRKWREALTAGGSVVPAGDGLLVVAGPRSLLEISAGGDVMERRELSLPDEVEISLLRRGETAEGKPVYAAFTPLQPGVHVFDSDWKLLFRYPSDYESPPIRDVQWSDLDENGESELLVALDGNAGLHAVSVAGERLWSNRSYAPLVSIALSHELPMIADPMPKTANPLPKIGRCAYVTGRGGICPITKDGIEGPAKEVSPWVIAHLFTSRFSNATQAAYAAIGIDAQGGPCVVGLNDVLLEEQWNYPLPGGSFQRPVDFVASGKLRPDSSGEWVVAWADGSVHIISEDGNFDDAFNTGFEVRGITVLETVGSPLLVVTTPKEVLAWEVEQ